MHTSATRVRVHFWELFCLVWNAPPVRKLQKIWYEEHYVSHFPMLIASQCLGCVERGKLIRHVSRTGHHFVIFQIRDGREPHVPAPITVEPTEETPPPYAAF